MLTPPQKLDLGLGAGLESGPFVVDEEVGVDPWARFPKLNFTKFINEQDKEVQRKAAARQTLIEEQVEHVHACAWQRRACL